MASDRVAGGCQCGAVRYEIDGPLGQAYACHCRDCQRQTGGAFSVSIPVLRDRLHVEGRIASFEKRADSGAATLCFYCPKCGGRLYHASSRSPEVATLKAGTLDDTSRLQPAGHLWVSRKQSWVRLDPSEPAFDEQPEDLPAWRRTLIGG